ncbi:GNAT family N-acetyltransferase [Cognatishimia activa]|uniref:GNAT family N-acetyltransferase n=1 Tax=Cognatishimia activa TaxID=1715691 RepID=UPI00222F1346|nr:GNAT family N-acetyltransferase [Cognatishimia activa]UZD90551.1 GNAT family N-acetyltransferase [Cognatishimia activa]
MTLPTIETLYDVCEATWPCASASEAGGFVIRDGQGGGKRVSAATLAGALKDADIGVAELAMASLDQSPLFQVREGEDTLDAILADNGYDIIDPVNVYAAHVDVLATERPPRTVAIPAWEPLQIMKEMWAAGGIGPKRIDVMHRAKGPKTGFVSRWQDKPAGTSYAAIHEGISMMHALEIKAEQRRNGLARWAMRRLAYWTMENGGETVSVICTQENEAANGLYQSLGMTKIGTYHYRIKA